MVLLVAPVVIELRPRANNAARYAQYLLGRAHHVPVAFATPSPFTLTLTR